ncbi:MAG: hypothetical protein AMXMBFR36_21740 [Acidobacteriota bacterium]
MTKVWTLAVVLAAAPLSAEIERPGCLPPAEVVAESNLPAELARGCATDPACWNEGLERARALVSRFESSYDAHRIRVLVARAAGRALGPEAVASDVAEYRELAAGHPANPAYAHLLAQLTLEGESYEVELARIAAADPDYPWAQLSIAYLLRPDADAAARAPSFDALERFVEICPLRYEPALAMLERSGDPTGWARLGSRLRGAAVLARDFVAAERLWRLGARLEGVDPERNARWLAEIRRDLETLVAGGLPDAVAELAALRRGYEMAGDAEGGARVDGHLLERQPCSQPARALLASRLRPRLADAPWLGVEKRRAIARDLRAELAPVLARCGDDEPLLTLEVEALALLGPDAGAELAAAVERWLALPEKRRGEPELWAAERLLEAGVGLDRVATLLASARASRSGAEASPQATTGAEPVRRWELRLAAALALAAGDPGGAGARLEELRAAMAAASPGSVGAAERAAVERIEAGWACATAPGEAALARWGPLVAVAPEGSGAEREARRCWIATRGGAEGFDAWRAERSRIASASGAWRTVDEDLPAVELTDLGRARIDLSDFAGKTLLLRAWAGWCGPCREELAALGELARRYEGRSDVAIRLVSVDDDPSPVIDLYARDVLAVEPWFGGGPLLESGFLDHVPAAWIVSPAGRVVRRQDGTVGDAPASWIEAAAAVIEDVSGAASATSPVAAP